MTIVATAQTFCGPGSFSDNGTCTKCPPGTFRTASGPNECEGCPAGTYSSVVGAQGADICKPCPEGTFLPTIGATSLSACKKCAPGTSSPKGSPSCMSCPPGNMLKLCTSEDSYFYSYYENGKCLRCSNFGDYTQPRETRCTVFTPQLKCVECPRGQISSHANSVECIDCELGEFANKDQTSCGEKCPPGMQYGESEGGCIKCFPGGFNDGTFLECQSCRPGFRSEKARGSTKCVPCPKGTARTQLAVEYSRNTCRRCRPGENSNVTGAEFCMPDNTPCPPNFFRSASGACLRCKKNQFLSRSKNLCVDCPADTVSDGGLVTKCSQCPKGTAISPILYHLKACLCKAGWELDPIRGDGSCRECAAGFANRDAGQRCYPCQQDQYAPERGMENCLPCRRGTHQPLHGQTKCIRLECAKGTVLADDGHSCIVPQTGCPLNHKRTEDSHGFLGCSPSRCPPNQFRTRPHPIDPTVSCRSCPKGTILLPESRDCLFCGDLGSSAGGLQTECTKCPEGFTGYFDECSCVDGKHVVDGKCVQCEAGSITESEKLGVCIPCPAGTFASGERYTCNNCRAGTFTSTPGQTSCAPCPAGTISFGIGDSGCVEPGSLKM